MQGTTSTPSGSTATYTDTMAYTIRGELKSDTVTPAANWGEQFGPDKFANGVALNPPPPTFPANVTPNVATWDARRGVQTGTTQGAPTGGTSSDYDTTGTTYDSAGRQTSSSEEEQHEVQCPGGGSQISGLSDKATTVTRTYDAENHVVSGEWTAKDTTVINSTWS